jgi:hypothetical protein
MERRRVRILALRIVVHCSGTLIPFSGTFHEINNQAPFMLVPPCCPHPQYLIGLVIRITLEVRGIICRRGRLEMKTK